MKLESNRRYTWPSEPLPDDARNPSFAEMTSRTVGSLHIDSIEPRVPSGTSVLCLHGLFAGAWVFERLLPAIAARGHVAAALSFRGHPPSPPLASMGSLSLADYAQDAADVARTMDRPVVIGHSLGGLVALMLAARNAIRGAVLISPAPPRGINVLSPPLLLRMGRYLPALLCNRPFLPTDGDLDFLDLNRVPSEQRAAIRSRFVRDSGRAARQAAFGSVPIPRSSVSVPLFVVSGDDDRFIPCAVSARVAQRYGAPLHIARGHGHFLLAEPGWEEHASLMFDWIGTLPGGGIGS